jgi:hypothetical protein
MQVKTQIRITLRENLFNIAGLKDTQVRLAGRSDSELVVFCLTLNPAANLLQAKNWFLSLAKEKGNHLKSFIFTLNSAVALDHLRLWTVGCRLKQKNSHVR